MDRMRSLTEEECYFRCYGWAGAEDAVKVIRPSARVEREQVAATVERVRVELEERLDERSRAA